jgi:hypothetical protein
MEEEAKIDNNSFNEFHREGQLQENFVDFLGEDYEHKLGLDYLLL